MSKSPLPYKKPLFIYQILPVCINRLLLLKNNLKKDKKPKKFTKECIILLKTAFSIAFVKRNHSKLE
jgi:hypothetical protein